MSEKFRVESLPAIDQQEIKRGHCPWCLSRLVDRGTYDECPDEDCGDTFHGSLTIED